MTTDGKNLIGRKIAAVEPIDQGSLEALGWTGWGKGTALILDDHTWLYVAQDEEQNGPGSLFHVGQDPVGRPKLVVPKPLKAVANG